MNTNMDPNSNTSPEMKLLILTRIKDEVIITEGEVQAENPGLLLKLIQSIEGDKDQDSIRETICYCYSENIE